MSEKIRPEHQQRLAVVYIRQSSPGQVRNHPESYRVQKGLVRIIQFIGGPTVFVRITAEIETASIVSGILRLTPSPAGWARPRGPLALRLNYGIISASIHSGARGRIANV